MKSLVSVVIPAYNASKFITQTICSVIDQNYRPIEIIIVDDASTDNTSSVVESLGLKEITFIRLECNVGASGARNIGIEYSKGDYIAFLDADDRWRPEKLSCQVDLLKSDVSLVLVWSDYITCRDGVQVGHPFEYFISPNDLANTWKLLLRYPMICPSSVVARKDALTKIGGFDESLVLAEDQDLFIKLALIGNVNYINKVLVEYNDTENSLTKREFISEGDYLLPMIERHVMANLNRLTTQEVREILGSRNFDVGVNLYCADQFVRCLPYFLRALMHGYKPKRTIWILIKIPLAWLIFLVKRVKQRCYALREVNSNRKI